MIKTAYQLGVKKALEDAGFIKESSTPRQLARQLAAAGLLGGELGGITGAVSPKFMGHDPLYEEPYKRIAKGGGLGALYGAAAGVGAGAAGLGTFALLKKLKVI